MCHWRHVLFFPVNENIVFVVLLKNFVFVVGVLLLLLLLLQESYRPDQIRTAIPTHTHCSWKQKRMTHTEYNSSENECMEMLLSAHGCYDLDACGLWWTNGTVVLVTFSAKLLSMWGIHFRPCYITDGQRTNNLDELADAFIQQWVALAHRTTKKLVDSVPQTHHCCWPDTKSDLLVTNCAFFYVLGGQIIWQVRCSDLWLNGAEVPFCTTCQYFVTSSTRDLRYWCCIRT